MEPNRKILMRKSGEESSKADRQELSLFDLGTVILLRKRALISIFATVMVLTVIVLLLMPNRYRSTASILPSGSQDKLADLKSLAGVGGLSSTDENSSELFPVILRSRLVRDAVLDQTYPVDDKDGTPAISLVEYFAIEDRDKLHRRLAKITEIGIDKKTGVISISVETESAVLSQAIAFEYMNQLESFNLHKRRSHARENERYLASQLDLRHEELKQAEDSLESFQMDNRDWFASSNPEIVKGLSRRKRGVEIKTQICMYLTQEFQAAKLEAQKDIPIVRLLDSPSLATQKSGPYRTVTVLLTGMVTLMVLLFGLVIYEGTRRKMAGESNEAFRSFKQEFSCSFPRVNRLMERRRTTDRQEQPTA